MRKSSGILLYFLIATVGSCINSSDKSLESTQKVTTTDSIKKSRPLAPVIPSNVDSIFETFLEYFNKDLLFQISRVDFPLKVKEADLDKDFDLMERTIQRPGYKKLNFTYDSQKTNKQTDSYKQNIKVNGSKAIIAIRGIDNGIVADYYFVKKNGKWTLQTWVNSST